jgi:hypothetical protein
MDGGGEGGLAAWLIDVAAASLLGAACAFAGTTLGNPIAGWAAGSAALLVSLLALRFVRPEPPTFRIPPFELAAVDVSVEQDILELTELEPLVLEDVLAAVEPGARVVRLFAQHPLPTAGELVRRIETHLGRAESPPESSATVVHLGADASVALREALADLRRSLG